MAYVAAADFRKDSLAEYCTGLVLSPTEAPSPNLTTTITRLSVRLENLTDDRFASFTETYKLSGDGTAALELPARCTAVSLVQTRDYVGTLSTQAATTYRLQSSLTAAGDRRISDDSQDFLHIVSGQTLQSVSLAGQWPTDPNSIEVTGTFGWTVTPADIKRALALMVYDHFKPLNDYIRRARTLATQDASYTFVDAIPGETTGITEADEILALYQRPKGVWVA